MGGWFLCEVAMITCTRQYEVIAASGFLPPASCWPDGHRMRALRDSVPGIEHLATGRDIFHEARSWALLLIMRFASVETLRRYQQHPDHQAAMAFNQSSVTEVGAVGFWQDA